MRQKRIHRCGNFVDQQAPLECLRTLLEDYVHRVHSNRRREETVTVNTVKIFQNEPDRLRRAAG